MNFTNKEKILIIALVAVLLLLSYFLLNEMVIKTLNPPEGYQLISNDNGVLLYKNPETGIFLEFKEANNAYNTYHSNCVGKKANVTVQFKKYTVTCYWEVQSNPTVPAVRIYSMGAGDTTTQLAMNGVLGHNHINAIDGGVLDLYE
ncbi:MAG: hypothetical protein IJH63_11555 [Methanobrevibacter sp.]|nr:hypothetical protein [Methanobrevibacter sp.]